MYMKNNSPATKEEMKDLLVEFANDFLIPAMSDMMDGKIDGLRTEMKSENVKLEHNLKTYIDRKLSDYTTDIFKRLEKESQKDKDYKQKVIEILKKNKIGTGEDIAFLQGFVNAL